MIKKITAHISTIKDITPTAKEIRLTTDEPFPFTAGAFVNIFVEKNGEVLRRAYSISSSDSEESTFSITVRLNPKGAITPMFWNESVQWNQLSIMGPLGINTGDKIQAKRVFLFGYGVGAGVVKSLADHLTKKHALELLFIMTGSRTKEDVMYEEYFADLADKNPNVQTRFTLSQGDDTTPQYKKGYIQEHIADLDFNNAAVYICGQEKAVSDLKNTILATRPEFCVFYEEAFH